jgi:hypothetical protein
MRALVTMTWNPLVFVLLIVVMVGCRSYRRRASSFYVAAIGPAFGHPDGNGPGRMIQKPTRVSFIKLRAIRG